MLNVSQTASQPTGSARYYPYSEAVDPVGAGILPQVPAATFPASLYGEARTQLVPLDLARELHTRWPCTSPALCAHFVRLMPRENLRVHFHATSELYFVLRGAGRVESPHGAFEWSQGDFFTLPAGGASLHGQTDSVLYYVNDAPLCAYLGVRPSQPRFAPTLFVNSRSHAELQRVRDLPTSAKANRISVILVDSASEATRSITPILWAMLGVLPKSNTQAPHRHQSVALDLIVECQPGCYSLIGDKIDAAGRIVDGQRVDWAAGMAFVTPPGLWHSHHNESTADALLVPVQDAGLHSHLRTLDICFSSQKE